MDSNIKNIKNDNQKLEDLKKYFETEAASFEGKAAYMFVPLDRFDEATATVEDAIIEAHATDKVVSASTIKVPMMMALLAYTDIDGVSLDTKIEIKPEDILDDSHVFYYGKDGRMPLNRIADAKGMETAQTGPHSSDSDAPETFDANVSAQNHSIFVSLYELAYWMIANSDNTATNAIIRYLGFEKLNYFFHDFGLENTRLERYMLDWDAIKEGKNNYTSVVDFYRCMIRIYTRTLHGDEKVARAMDLLCHNRDYNDMLRYIYEDVICAHKTGGLDDIVHDGGIFDTEYGSYFLAVFTSEFAPTEEMEHAAERLTGRLSRAVLNYYKDKAKSE